MKFHEYLLSIAILLLISAARGMVLTEGVWEHCIESPDLICEKFGTPLDLEPRNGSLRMISVEILRLSTSMMTLFQIVYHGILWGPVWEAFWTHETTWRLVSDLCLDSIVDLL